MDHAITIGDYLMWSVGGPLIGLAGAGLMIGLRWASRRVSAKVDVRRKRMAAVIDSAE
jgi:hypothetical protein